MATASIPQSALGGAIKPFTPPILGGGTIGQFGTFARFEIGFYLVMASLVVILIGLWFHRRAYKPVADARKRAHARRRNRRRREGCAQIVVPGVAIAALTAGVIAMAPIAPASPPGLRYSARPFYGRAARRAALSPVFVTRSSPASGSRLIVSPEGPYSTIQAALADARDGDVIEVHAGVYGGPLVVDKTVALRRRRLAGRSTAASRAPS